jgi:hypothetical protein
MIKKDTGIIISNSLAIKIKKYLSNDKRKEY